MINKQIQDLLEQRKKPYLGDPRLIVTDYESEREKIEEYNGRQLLEMLQNANDAAAEINKTAKVLVELKENALLIANTGSLFSLDGIESILYINLITKFNRENVIGAKGLGFRSILSWAKKITILSGELTIEFSESNAHLFLKEILDKNPNISEVINLKSKVKKPIGILRCPRILNQQEVINSSCE